MCLHPYKFCVFIHVHGELSNQNNCLLKNLKVTIQIVLLLAVFYCHVEGILYLFTLYPANVENNANFKGFQNKVKKKMRLFAFGVERTVRAAYKYKSPKGLENSRPFLKT